MGNSSDSSDNERSSRVTFKKLSRNNWATWVKRFDNIVTAKGYKNLMKPEWIAANKSTSEYRMMSAWAMNKLFAMVKEELHPILTANDGDIFGSIEALARACGEKLVIALCDKLFTLINSVYVSGASLSEHLVKFRRNYTALTSSIQANPHFMSISSGLAAALLLRSLHQDEGLTPLVQLLYDAKPFNFEKIYDRLLIEDTRKESAYAESAYFATQNRRFGKKPSDQNQSTSASRGSSSTRGSHRGGFSGRGNFRGVAPTQSAPIRSNNDNFARQFREQMKLYMSGQPIW